jgi:hypothetical protein
MLETNYLLTISRFTEHFYAMRHNLQGRDAMYQNPGFALRSFVVAKCLKYEFTKIDSEELNQAYQDCEAFSSDPDNVLFVMNELMRQSTELIRKILKLPVDSQKKLETAGDNLAKKVQDVRSAFESYIELGGDPTVTPGLMLKDLLYSLQEMILDLAWSVDAELPPVQNEDEDDDGPEVA